MEHDAAHRTDWLAFALILISACGASHGPGPDGEPGQGADADSRDDAGAPGTAGDGDGANRADEDGSPADAERAAADDGSPTDPGGDGDGKADGDGSRPGESSGQERAVAVFRPDAISPQVHLVVDASGSMADDFGGETRWAALRSALLGPGGVVPELESRVEFGMVLYDGHLDPLAGTAGGLDAIIPGLGATLPTGEPAECPRLRQVAPARNNLAALDAEYPQEPLGGSTPTHYALDAVTGGLGSRGEGQYVVLATDGIPNDFCEGGAGEQAYDEVIAAAQRLTAQGAELFVISMAGDLADEDAALQAHLEQLAQIGGTGHPPFSPVTKDDLVAALQRFAGDALTCTFALDKRVSLDEQCHGLVELDGRQLPCQDPDGWELLDERTLKLNGAACVDVGRPNSTLRATFPCPLLSD